MKQWDDRPIEIASLLNPAFCYTVLQHAIWKYQSITKKGLPYPIAFLILPMILHQGSRNLMPERTSSKLLIWIQDHPEILVNFSERSLHLIPITKEAIMFGTSSGNLLINKKGELFVSTILSIDNENNREVLDCYKKSSLLGNWFSTSGSTEMIFSIFGVKP